MAKKLYLILLLLLVNLLNLPLYTHGANVLAVLPSVWKSHYLFGRRLLEELVAHRNYSVTIISPHASLEDYDAPPPTDRIREIRIEGLMENWLEMGLSFHVEQIRSKSIMERFTRLIYAGTANVDLLLANAQVRKMLRSGERFDLLVVDLFLSDSLLGLAFYYQIPTVAISPSGANTWLNHMTGNPQSSALDPSNFLPFSERMNFWERSVNTLMGVFEKLTYNFFHMISQQAVYKKHFENLCQLANATLPHHSDLTKNLSLVLINSHPIVQYPRAYLPNMLEIAGAHLNSQLKLPNHLQEYIETASQGVVYMSLGADAHTSDLAREKLDAILDAFSYLKDMRFLLKWEQVQFDGTHLPGNVMIDEWFPQEAILAHSNVKVFISSCGLMSVIEALSGATPILAIPIYPEQEVTAKHLQKQGAALAVSFDAITYDAILYAIQQLAFNTSFTDNTRKLHYIFTENFGTPISKSLHYIDLVLKTQGGDFFKSHANNLNFVRSELIDVIGIITVGLFCIIAVPFLVTSCILRKSYYNQANISSASPNYRSGIILKVPLGRTSSLSAGGDNFIPEVVGVRCRRTSTSLSVSSGSSSSGSPQPPTSTSMSCIKKKREGFIRNSQSSQQSD